MLTSFPYIFISSVDFKVNKYMTILKTGNRAFTKENRAFRIFFITKKKKKKQTGFPLNFLETPILSVHRCLIRLFQRTLFLMFPLFQKYINSQVRTNKMVNILSYFFKLLRPLSLSRMLVEFSLACIFNHLREKILNS